MRSATSVLGLALLMGACVSSPAPSPTVSVAPQGPRPVSGWLAGPAGQQLAESDRERAFAAQITAVETGTRASWRSAKGDFGVVEPGAEAAGIGGTCRPFSHTIYIDGRAQRGTGSACRSANGIWDVVS